MRGYLGKVGSGRSVVANSPALGKDLGAVGKSLLSYGQDDHTGGMPEVLILRGEVEVHPHILSI